MIFNNLLSVYPWLLLNSVKKFQQLYLPFSEFVLIAFEKRLSNFKALTILLTWISEARLLSAMTKDALAKRKWNKNEDETIETGDKRPKLLENHPKDRN